MNPFVYNIMEYAVAIIVSLAFLSSLAIRRTPLINEPPLVETGRNLLVGGWLLLSIRLWYLAIWDTRVEMSVFGMVSFSILALGGIVISCARLFPAEVTHPCAGCPYIQIKEEKP